MDKNQSYGHDTWDLPPAWSEDVSCYKDADPNRQVNINDAKDLVKEFCSTKSMDLPQGQSLNQRKQNVFLEVTARKGEPHYRCSDGVQLSHHMAKEWCLDAFDNILECSSGTNKDLSSGGFIYHACGDWTVMYKD